MRIVSWLKKWGGYFIPFFPLKRFQTKITVFFILVMLLTSFLSNLLIGVLSYNRRFDELRHKLMIIAQTASLMIDGETIKKVPLNKNGVRTEEFRAISEKLNRIKNANPDIRYIYTMARTADRDTLQFVVDPEYIYQEKEKTLTSYPGDLYDASRFPEMQKAFYGPNADTRPGMDEWGYLISGYAPIYDKTGRSVAILGVDVGADNIFLIRSEVFKRGLQIFGISFIIAVFLGTILANVISRPIRKIIEATHHISTGDFNYHLDVSSGDELSEVASSFNAMTERLAESRDKLIYYYYRTVQSLVTIMEARDPYTKGHSERVTYFAELIARRMGLSEEQIELLKKATLLHDIGKLGIQEHILYKKERLTVEEWEVIQKHPGIGEQILSPIFPDHDMLRIVKEHHERFDGTGYPDKKNGGDIGLLSAIVSVADSYDAMTSCRAYRSALEKADAIRELEQNSGSQFNPRVVKAFLKILNEEKIL
ncbi:MAG: HD domain-containing protein [bacterium]|nr:HD domain-containing protein [bacterium]